MLPKTDKKFEDECRGRAYNKTSPTNPQKLIDLQNKVCEVFRNEFEYQNQVNQAVRELFSLPKVNLTQVFKLVDTKDRGFADYDE